MFDVWNSSNDISTFVGMNMKTIRLSGWNDVNILNYEKSREIETCSLKLEFKLICKLKDSHVE